MHSNRRLKRAIQSRVEEISQGEVDMKIMIAGLSNVYTHYITTYEEYQRQRYEAASTIFGPHTLRAYIEQFMYLTDRMLLVRQLIDS